MRSRTKLLALALVAIASAALADPLQLSLKRAAFDIGSAKGKTYFSLLSQKPGGIKEALDADGPAKFKLGSKDAILAAKQRVHPNVYGKFIRAVKGGEAGLDKLAAAYPGDTTTLTLPDDVFKTHLIQPMGKYDIGPFLSLASGAGVAVRIDADSLFFNVGYGDGTHPNDEMTGRSFGHGPQHKALDASDAFYLDELEKYLTTNPDSSAFYRAIFGVLTSCDPSGFAALDPAGKTVATDFLAVYTAEADRHLMSGLKQHPWENDLAEVTLISAFSVASGKLMQQGKLVDGKLVGWWAKSATSNRSGIGETRNDRRKLQAAAVNYERKNHPDLVHAVEAVVGKRASGDVFEAALEHLNNFHTPASLGASAAALTEGIVKLIGQIRADAKAIEATLPAGAAQPPPAKGSASKAPARAKPAH